MRVYDLWFCGHVAFPLLSDVVVGRRPPAILCCPIVLPETLTTGISERLFYSLSDERSIG